MMLEAGSRKAPKVPINLVTSSVTTLQPATMNILDGPRGQLLKQWRNEAANPTAETRMRQRAHRRMKLERHPRIRGAASQAGIRLATFKYKFGLN